MQSENNGSNNGVEIYIPLQTPAQKNAKTIAMNRRTGKPFIMSAKPVKDWQQEASKYLFGVKPISGAVSIRFDFVNKDRRGRDLDNMATSLLDLLKNNSIIEDDKCFIVQHIEIHFNGVDTKNYGVAIKIKQIA